MNVISVKTEDGMFHFCNRGVSTSVASVSASFLKCSYKRASHKLPTITYPTMSSDNLCEINFACSPKLCLHLINTSFDCGAELLQEIKKFILNKKEM